MALADLKDDGDYKLVVVDQSGKLKIYMGTNVIYNEKLSLEKTGSQQTPCGLQTFYDSTKKPMIPIIAVAAGSAIYYFQSFQPLLRFELPYIQFSQEEKDIWQKLNHITPDQDLTLLTDRLFAMREGGTTLSTISAELLSLESVPE